MCYGSSMATKKRQVENKRRQTQLQSAMRRTAQVREHYRRFRIKKPGGKWYNPILDDPDRPGERNPLNTSGFAHGTLAGYRDGGCTYCDPCAAAGRAENQRQERRRLANRLDDHRARVTTLLAGRFPNLSSEVINHGAEVIVSQHRVRQKSKAIVGYEPASVELALNNWSLVSRISLNVRDIPDLAAAITQELTS